MPCAFFTPTLNFRDSCSIWHHGLITWGDIWPKVYILENLLLLFCQYSLSFWINWSGCETLKCHGLKTTTKKSSCFPIFFLIPSSISYSWQSSHPLRHCWQYLQTGDGSSVPGPSTKPSPIIPIVQCYLWGSIREKYRRSGNMFPQVFSTNNRKRKSWKSSHQIHKMLVSCWGKRRGAKAKQLNLILIGQDLSSVNGITNHRQILHLNSISRGVGSSIFPLKKENISTNILHYICYSKNMNSLWIINIQLPFTDIYVA